MKVIVGLGNPGAEYGKTRHNMGWAVLDALTANVSATRFRREKSVDAAEGSLGGEKIFLLKPQTYMNRSGQALASWLGWMTEVRDALQKEDATAEAALPREEAHLSKQDRADDAECRWPGLLVIADDVNLPVGRMRFRPAGSAGGHNGLSDMEKALGGRGYPRLRLGVGAVPERMDRADYVLGRFRPEEFSVVLKTAEVAARAAEDWCGRGMAFVRNRYNGLVVGGGE